jgi:hypothetical protein
VIYTQFLACLFDPDTDKTVLMDRFFEIAPVASVAAAIVLAVIGFTIGALLIREFWNRLVADLSKTRTINYQEALAILLMFTILFG